MYFKKGAAGRRLDRFLTFFQVTWVGGKGGVGGRRRGDGVGVIGSEAGC